MAKTILTVRQLGVSFFMNTETSSPNTGKRNRYRLFKTENFGRDKAGWVQVGSTAGQALIAIKYEAELFKACAQAFGRKRARPYVERQRIRGAPGKWEGEAFPARVMLIRYASVFMHTENLSRQTRGGKWPKSLH